MPFNVVQLDFYFWGTHGRFVSLDVLVELSFPADKEVMCSVIVVVDFRRIIDRYGENK
jgi:hypothetical protein